MLFRSDHSSADAVFGIHGIHDSICICAGGAVGKISGRKMDSPYAAMDDDCVGISEHRDFAGRALGVCGTGLGRILGMGPGGECVAAAVAHRNCVSAFGDDAREARDDESVERVAGVPHVLVMYFWDISDAQRRGEFGACVRAIFDRPMVRRIFDCDRAGVRGGVFQKQRLFEEQQPTGFAGVARIELSF